MASYITPIQTFDHFGIIQTIKGQTREKKQQEDLWNCSIGECGLEVGKIKDPPTFETHDAFYRYKTRYWTISQIVPKNEFEKYYSWLNHEVRYFVGSSNVGRLTPLSQFEIDMGVTKEEAYNLTLNKYGEDRLMNERWNKNYSQARTFNHDKDIIEKFYDMKLDEWQLKQIQIKIAREEAEEQQAREEALKRQLSKPIAP